MTLLLKSVWRNVLRGGSFSPAALNIRCSSVTSTELTKPRTPDIVMTRIRSAASADAVLSEVAKNIPNMTHRHLLQALRTLFDLQRAGKFEQDTEHIVKDPNFRLLCQNIKKMARSFEVNESIEAVKVLAYLKVPVDSIIVQTMLQLLRCNINLLSLRQIMFLDFVLTRFDSKNHLVDALKLALPLAFQIHLPFELDNQDLPLLKDMLIYCCTHDLPDRCINNVVTGLLLHDQALDAQTAKSIIWSLCEVKCAEDVFPTRVQLLHICCDILAQSIRQLSYDDVLRTVARIKGRVVEKHREYYHEQLIDAIANYVIDNDIEFEKSLLVARVLSRMAHTHLGLVEYLCHKAAATPNALSNARTNILFGFINCLSNSNYTPGRDIWPLLKQQISQNPVLNATNAALPWTKVCLELASLGHYEDKVLSRVFSREFLKEYLAREENTLDYLQLLTLYEAVKTFHSQDYVVPTDILQKAKNMYPTHALTEQLEEHLQLGLGDKNYVATNVVLPSGIISDALVCLKNGYPFHLPSLPPKTPIGQYNLPQDGVVVCILNFSQGCFSLNSNRLRGSFRLIADILEKQGYISVPVNLNEWLSAPAHERTSYLMREIGYKCGEIGMKLCAT